MRFVSYYPIIDSIFTELSERINALEANLMPFNFLLNLEKLTDEDIRTAAKCLIEKYSMDLGEGIQFHYLIR